MSESITTLMAPFAERHPDDRVQEMRHPFALIADEVAGRAPDDADTRLCLRLLREAREAAVRAGLRALRGGQS